MNEYKSFFKTVTGNEGNLCHYSTRLDTYGCGCSHNCSYCYARSLLEFRGLWHPENPSVADLDKVKRKLARVKPGSVLRLGGMTDCFQPVEKLYRVTYGTILEMNRLGIEYLVVTKSAMVADPEYMGVYDKRLAHFQVSITATDDTVAGKYENASLVSKRIEAIEKLQAAGFDVSIRLSPFIPEFIDKDKINAIECDKILVEFLRCNAFIRKAFPVDYNWHILRHSNYLHLPLDKKLEYLEEITIRDLSVCDDVPEHRFYFMEHINRNPNDCCNLRRYTHGTENQPGYDPGENRI